MDNHSEVASEDNSSIRAANARLLVTHEGLLDPALLKRKEGYMHKKGGAVNARGGFRNWKKRWFVIAPVEILGAHGYELQYYDAPNGNLKGKVGLSEIEILCETKSQHKLVKHEFQIVLQNGGILELSCDDYEEREEWMETLNMITAYLRKVLTSTSMTLDGYDPFDEDDETSFNIGEEIAQNCQAFGPGLFGAEAGTQSQFVVQIHDLVGQQVTRGGMPISATLSNGEALYYLRVIDNDDGTYFCQYMLGRAGSYKLSIRLNDEHHIFGSPFDMEILPSRTVARYCVAHGEALSSIMANQTQTFTIVAMDGFGNRKNNGGDPFEVGVMGPAQLRALVDNGDGSYTCTLAAQSPSTAAYVTSASLMVLVTLHGKPIDGSPFKPIITEDLRALYNSASSVAGSVAAGQSAASVMSSPAGSVQQSPYFSKHAMAQQQPQQAPTTPSASALESMLDELDIATPPPAPAQSTPSVAGSVGNASVASRRTPPPPSGPRQGSSNSVVSASKSVVSSGAASVASRSPVPTAASAKPSPAPSAGASKPSASATALAAVTANSGGGGLSRLERSRQRALLAKALSESAAPTAASSDSAPNNVGTPVSPSPQSGTGDKKLTKLEELQRSISGNNAPQQQQRDSNSTRPVSSEFLSVVVNGLRQGLGGNIAAGGTAGSLGMISPGYPANATQNEIKIWDHTQKAFLNEEVIRLVCSNLEILRQVFDTFSDFVEGVQVIKLATSGNQQGGLYRLLELYDVLPTYLSKVETKVLFTLTLHAQRNVRSPAAAAGGGTGLDFCCFLKFLIMIAYHALSKTNSFSSLYATIESKVEVMLFKWALADPLKLQVVSASLRSNASVTGASAASLSDEMDTMELVEFVNEAHSIEHVESSPYCFRKNIPKVSIQEVESDLLSMPVKWLVLETPIPEEIIVGAARLRYDSARNGKVDCFCVSNSDDGTKEAVMRKLLSTVETVCYNIGLRSCILEAAQWRTDLEAIFTECGYEEMSGHIWPESTQQELTKPTMVLEFHKVFPTSVTADPTPIAASSDTTAIVSELQEGLEVAREEETGFGLQQLEIVSTSAAATGGPDAPTNMGQLMNTLFAALHAEYGTDDQK